MQQYFILHNKEGNNYDLFFDVVKKIKQSLKRHKQNLSSAEHSSFINTCKLIEALGKSDFERLKIDIKGYKGLRLRSWCIKQIELYNSGGKK